MPNTTPDPHELVLVTDSKLPGHTYPVKRLRVTADPDRFTIVDGEARTPQGFPVAPIVDTTTPAKAATKATDTKN